MKTTSRTKLMASAVLVGCLAIVLFYPFKTTIVPEWTIRIVDVSGNPVPNVVVREQWRNHSIELEGHDESRTTDNQGYLSFPRRTVRASLVLRILGKALTSLNAHGESGPKASAIVLGPYLTSRNPDYDPERPSPEVIVIRPQP